MFRPSASANEQPGGEISEYETYLELMQACRAIAPRVDQKHTGMFPNLHSMYTLDAALLNAPLGVQIRAMRVQLEFLQSLDDSPMFGRNFVVEELFDCIMISVARS